MEKKSVEFGHTLIKVDMKELYYTAGGRQVIHMDGSSVSHESCINITLWEKYVSLF